MKNLFVIIYLISVINIHSQNYFNEIILKKENAFTKEYKQKYKLSCEIATLRALLKYYDIDITEDEIINKIPKNKNPHLGFRGNIDGIQKNSFLDDYGIYPQGLKNYLTKNTNLKASIFGNINDYSYIKNKNPLSWLKSMINSKKPVIVWIIKYCDTVSKFSKYDITDGKLYLLLYKEHTVIVIGYKEFRGAQGNNEIIVFDPTYGAIFYYNEKNFVKSWSNFSYMALTLDDIK
jgi:uncharacterized protein YvpB